MKKAKVKQHTVRESKYRQELEQIVQQCQTKLEETKTKQAELDEIQKKTYAMLEALEEGKCHNA